MLIGIPIKKIKHLKVYLILMFTPNLPRWLFGESVLDFNESMGIWDTYGFFTPNDF